MHTLQELLDRAIKKYGEGSRTVQSLRDQIAAEESGQGFQELYITGAVKFPDEQKDAQKPPRDSEE